MRGDSSQLGAGLAEVGLAQNGVGKNLRVSRSTLGLSVFRLYCFLADPKRTVPGSLLGDKYAIKMRFSDDAADNCRGGRAVRIHGHGPRKCFRQDRAIRAQGVV